MPRALKILLFGTLLAGVVLGVLAARTAPRVVPPVTGVGVQEVGTQNIADLAVTSSKIANGAVTSSKIASGAITADKIADGAVTSSKIADGAVTGAKIADGSITADDIADRSITGAKIAPGAITISDLGITPGSATFVVATSPGEGDYTSIQDAIDALPATGGKILIKDGVYAITSSIQVPSNVSLVGSGSATVIRVSAAVDAIKNKNYSGDENIIIGRVTVDCSSGLNGIYFSNVRNSKVLEVWISGAGGDGINIGGLSENNVIGNNVIRGCVKDGITLYSVAGSQPRFNVITGNISEGNTLRGITLWESSNNVLTGNVVRRNGEHGIRVMYGSNYNTLSSNIVESNIGIGVLVAGSSNNSLANNIITGSTQDGIKLENCESKRSIQNVISGNQCSGNGNYGIYLCGGSDYNSISGNQCSGNTNTDGIMLENSHCNAVSGNQCSGNGRFGVLLKQADNNIVSSNRAHGNKGNIKVENSDNNLLVGNFATGAWIWKGIEIDKNSSGNKLGLNQSYGNSGGDIVDDGVGTMYIGTDDITDNAVTSAKLADNIELDNLYVTSLYPRSGLSHIAMDNVLMENLYVTSIFRKPGCNYITMDNVVAENLRVTQSLIMPEGSVTPSNVTFSPGAATFVVATSLDNGDFTDIQQAINALPNGGGSVYIREGTYAVSSPITISNSNVMLVGSGPGTLITISSGNVIFASGAENVVVSTLRVRGGTNGIVFNGVVNSRISGCVVEGVTLDGIKLEGSENNIVASNIVRYAGSTGIVLWNSRYNLISGNSSEKNVQNGIYAGGDSYSIRNVITNNGFNNNGVSGIYLWQASQFTITGNSCEYNAQYGIYMSTCYEHTVTGNNFTGNNGGVRLINSYRITISSAVVYYSSADGITIDSGSQNVVSGCTVHGRGSGTGIVVNGNYNIVSSNYIGNHDFGLGMWGGDNNAVLSNKFYGNANKGIHLSVNSDNNLISNNDLFGGGVITDEGSGNSYGAGNRRNDGTWGNAAG